MKKYDGNLEHFIVIKCDYTNDKMIRKLLDNCDEIKGNILDSSRATVITSCPNCGDNEFWYYGKCGHCGYEIN